MDSNILPTAPRSPKGGPARGGFPFRPAPRNPDVVGSRQGARVARGIANQHKLFCENLGDLRERTPRDLREKKLIDMARNPPIPAEVRLVPRW